MGWDRELKKEKERGRTRLSRLLILAWWGRKTRVKNLERRGEKGGDLWMNGDGY